MTIQLPYLSSLVQVSNHNNDGDILFGDHPPKGSCSALQRPFNKTKQFLLSTSEREGRQESEFGWIREEGIL